MQNKQLILDHYSEQAFKWKDDPRSTMEDETTRRLEVAKIRQCVKLIIASSDKDPKNINICDVGCGNGYTLKELASEIPSSFVGMDLSEEMLAVTGNTYGANVKFIQGDIARTDDLPALSFDIVYTERCLINILDEDNQYAALKNICNMLNPGGYYVMLESFRDGLELSNKARHELGLEPISAPYHNLFFDKHRFLDSIQDYFKIIDVSNLCQNGESQYSGENFLSSYYFMSRVVYPLITKKEVMRNTEFVKFFSFLPPIGNYAPNQCFILQKLEGA